jgi:Protein of unknown function (DUF1302)
MKTTSRARVLRRVAAWCVACGIVPAAQAIDFEAGGFNGSWDTTLSLGQLYRVQSPNPDLIGAADGGRARSPNNDDGDLNYTTGLVSSVAKIVSEVSVKRENFGAFVRGSALYDFEAGANRTHRTPLTNAAKDLVGGYTRLLDAFAYGKFSLGSMPFELRIGRQAVSWGESTFIQNGINVLNPFDVSALRAPGSELKEGVLPESMVYASLKATENFSIDALYLLDWHRTKPEPAGSYFSTNDYAADGGSKVVLGFGKFSDAGVDFRPLGGALIPDFQAVKRGPTIDAGKSGQFGIALRYYAPNFNGGTEFGLFVLSYNSRLPLISGRTGSVAGIANAIGAATAVQAAAQGIAGGLPAPAAIATAAQVAVASAAARGGNLALATATQYATVGLNTFVNSGGSLAALAGQAGSFATHEYAQTASYFTEYPEDIKLLGLSFNTQLGRSGIALQGELAYRQDAPLQYDDVELLFAANSPLDTTLCAARKSCLPAPGGGVEGPLAHYGQLGRPALNQVVKGWGRFDTYQFQLTGTKTFSAVLGAAQAVIVAEAGATYVSGLPDKSVLRLNGPGTNVSGNQSLADLGYQQSLTDPTKADIEPAGRFADATSWGYRIASRLEYDNLIGPWNVIPRLVWSQDVHGTTPGPGGNFVEGRHGLTLGVGANLRNTWEADLSYTAYGGAGRYNDLTDRDFVAASVKYSF